MKKQKQDIDVLELTGQIQIVQGNHLSLPLNEECMLVMVNASDPAMKWWTLG